MNTYTFHISFYDLAFLGVIFIGLTFAVLLFFAKSINQPAKRFLGLALAVMVLWMVRLLGTDIRIGIYYAHWSRLPPQFSLALGPLIFFYVLKLTRPERKFSWKDLLHFIPVLLQLGVQFLSVESRLNPVLQLLTFISMIAYLYLSHRLIESFYQRLKFIGGDRYRNELQWLHRLLVVFGFLWLLWIPYTAIDYFYYHNRLGTQAYYPLELFLAMIFIGIAVISHLRQETTVRADAPSLFKPSPPAELKEKGIWLKKVVKTNCYYQDPELSLVSLAEKLNLTTHELSRIINVVLKKSFNDFINEFRVAEAARKMQDTAFDHITLLGIAYESGFNSKSTFNRAFRQMTGKSAAEYKVELKKERPSYNLTRNTQVAAIISYRQTTPKWSHGQLNYHAMFRNYLKIAFRSFWKRKVFTFINIVGLSIGISASLVIYLIVNYDFTFDKFEKDGDRVYRVVSNWSFQGNPGHSSGVTAPLAGAIKSNASGIEFTAPLYTLVPDVEVGRGSGAPFKLKAQDHITLADQNYFKIFNYTWLAGSPATALNDAYHVVLTSDRAKLYFPKLSYDQMIGKVVTYYDTLKTTVTGIVAPLKGNTDFSCHDFISFSSAAPETGLGKDVRIDQWGNVSSAFEVLIKLYPRVAAAKVQAQVNAIYQKNNPESADDLKNGKSQSYTFQPLSDIHFNRDYGTFDFSSPANKTTLYLLLLVAGFLLILGCINFINLTTAQATQRAKEIGIRKTMGSSRRQLVIQFLSETFFITLLAVIISVGLAPFILKLFADFISPGIKADFIGQPGVFLFLLGLTILVSFLAGFYPALMLSGFKPALVLKSQAQSGSSKTGTAWMRKSLTVSQFVIAQFFIMATLLVSKQIYYALHKDLGFKKDAIVFINTPYKVRKANINNVLANQLRALPGVKMVSIGTAAPSSHLTNIGLATYKVGKTDINTPIEIKYADENYVKLYSIKIIAGRNIRAGDSTTALVVNEKYAHVLGFTDPAKLVGKNLEKVNSLKNLRVVGIAGDFYTRSLQSPINPVAIIAKNANNAYQNGTIHIALKPEMAAGGWQKTIAAIGKIWKESYSDEDFDYQFYDKSIQQFYTQEEHTSTLLTWATGLSILISCLGLLGLAIHTTNQRTKEIGVRKVLGASVSQIVALLSRELVLLILLAFVIVTPLAWLAMNKWMESYADKTSISWWIFVASGAGMLLVAFITSSFQTIKAAIVNPVRSLRSE